MITKQALGNLLFGMADILRDKVEDYKSYILSLLFFKRLSDNYQWEIEHGKERFVSDFCREPSAKELEVITAKMHDFVIPKGCFWEDVRNASIDKKNETLDNAVAAIADQNVDKNGKYILKGIINTVRWNEPAPDGSGGKKLDPEVLSNLINYLGAVDLSNKNVTVDVLGDAYEYLIKRFADENKGGTMAGQFYTPQEVVDIIVRYLKPQQGDTIYDPTCGSGGFLLNAAKKGWYREDANMSVLEPQDVLRISTMLESWGDIDKAKAWIADRKLQLNSTIQIDLEYTISEIEKDAAEDIAIKTEKLNKAKKVVQDKEEKGKKPTKGELKSLETSQNALDKLIADKTAKIKVVKEKAEKQRKAIADVETELLQMFADPELRKRYFAIVDMDDIEENEFNLNIPRYVDTFEPEEQIDLQEAIRDFQTAMQTESEVMKSLNDLLNTLKANNHD